MTSAVKAVFLNNFRSIQSIDLASSCELYQFRYWYLWFKQLFNIQIEVDFILKPQNWIP